MICANFISGLCSPTTTPLNLTNWFAKPKPAVLPAAKKPSGKRLKVLHLSDLHLDPRTAFVFVYNKYIPYRLTGYTNGAEANCTSYQCCRDNVVNSQNPNEIMFPAPRFGAYLW